MKVYTLDVESSQRDPTLYAYANNYVVTLENPVYDVEKIELVSARIPTPQRTIDITNSTFSVDGADVTLDAQNYTSGTALATALQSALDYPVSNVDSVVYTSATDTLLFSNVEKTGHFTFEFSTGTDGYQSNTSTTTPHQVMGFGSSNVSSNVGYAITSGAVSLSGPNALYVRITTGSDDFTKEVYTGTPFYTGKIHLTGGGDYVDFSGADDPIVHDFHSGAQKVLDSLKIEFFYMSHGRLIPYNFRNQEHSLKFKITCSVDRLENLSRVKEEDVEGLKLPPPVHIPEEKKNLNRWQDYVPIGVIILVGLLMMVFIGRPQPRTPAPAVGKPSG
jgi:hypothetical protein